MRNRCRVSCKFAEFRKCHVFVGERETIGAPGFRIWIDLVRFDKSIADLKSLATTNPNYLVTKARIAPVPSLLINCSVPFPGNLSVSESIVPKFLWQRLVGMAFLTPTLSPSARFSTRCHSELGDRHCTASFS